MNGEHITLEVINLDVGHRVFCDSCNREFTGSKEGGGIQFQSKAIGPCCAEHWERAAVKHNETGFIRARCPDGKSFADWVRDDLR